MTIDSYNPDDPEFLASRSLDEDLSDAESRSLSKRQEAAPELDRFVRDVEGVAALVKRWGSRDVVVDEASFVEGVLGRIADEHERDVSDVDQVLLGWSASQVDVDEADFVSRVSHGLVEKPRRKTGVTLPRRLRRPLSVAASVGLALAAVLWLQFERRSVVEVVIRESYVEVVPADADTGPSRVVVFERSTLADARQHGEGRTSILVIGTEPFEDEQDDLPPL